MPTLPILVGTHHKTGTVWMHDTFQRIVLATGLRLSALSGRGEAAPADILMAHHSQFTPHMLNGRYRGLHVIRDPRDIIISSLFYHLKSDEPWLHFPRPRLGGLTYQQKLSGLDPDERFAFEIRNAAAWTIEELLLWRYDNPAFHEARYEDLIVDREGRYFATILEFLGFEEAEVQLGRRVFLETSIFGKTPKPDDPHIRSGRVGQWKQFYRRHHGQLFIEVFRDCLIRLGYEADHTWVERMPP